jgi:hypothetical protein
MLARVVYYHERSIPDEIILVTNDPEKAESIAREKMREFDAVAYEVEWVA